jgi:hypothetical protein
MNLQLRLAQKHIIQALAKSLMEVFPIKSIAIEMWHSLYGKIPDHFIAAS